MSKLIQDLKNIETFVRTNVDGGSANRIKQAVERIESLEDENKKFTLRSDELEKALLQIYDSPGDTDNIIDIAYDALNGNV